MTRSIDPILVSLAPYTAVPSTLSLPIREPVSLASVTMRASSSVEVRATDGPEKCSGEGVTQYESRLSSLAAGVFLFDCLDRDVSKLNPVPDATFPSRHYRHCRHTLATKEAAN
jgi:hypothetical protein